MGPALDDGLFQGPAVTRFCRLAPQDREAERNLLGVLLSAAGALRSSEKISLA
jgi:hypothetical protein